MEENSSEPHSENWGVWPKEAAAWKQPGLKDASLGAVMGGFPQGNRAQEPQGGEGSEERQVGGTGPRSLSRSLTQPRLRFHQLLPEYLIRRQEAPPCCATPETRLDPDARTLPGDSARRGGSRHEASLSLSFPRCGGESLFGLGCFQGQGSAPRGSCHGWGSHCRAEEIHTHHFQ